MSSLSRCVSWESECLSPPTLESGPQLYRSPLVRSPTRPPRVELAYAAVNMPSKAARRPARPARAPRFTRATAPAHSNPSCTGAFFLDFDSFIRQNPHKEKRDPKQQVHAPPFPWAERNTIPLGSAFLAVVSAGRGGPTPPQINPRKTSPTHPRPRIRTTQTSDFEIAQHRSTIADSKSLSHRLTRERSLTADIFGD
jgi:hypothetical protein